MNPITDPNVRARRITRTSYVGIGANSLLAGFKAAVGLLSNSVAIVLDAVNNLTDALSSVLTILGVKLARRPPDEKHPFGYGRIEYFSAIAIAALVLAAGAGSTPPSVRYTSKSTARSTPPRSIGSPTPCSAPSSTPSTSSSRLASTL